MGEGQGQSKTYPDMDILVKLTSKLQEASSTYEQLKDDMNKTREVCAKKMLAKHLCLSMWRNEKMM